MGAGLVGLGCRNEKEEERGGEGENPLSREIVGQIGQKRSFHYLHLSTETQSRKKGRKSRPLSLLFFQENLFRPGQQQQQQQSRTPPKKGLNHIFAEKKTSEKNNILDIHLATFPGKNPSVRRR